MTANFRSRRIKPIRQTEVAECGLACLTMIVSAHGAETDLAAMRQQFLPSLRGTSLRSLMEIADGVGLIGRALQLPLEELADLELPAILHWDLSHFVVLERIKGGRYLIHDPAYGTSWMRAEAVSRHFTGIALELRSSNAFRAPAPEPRLRMRQLWSRMNGAGHAAAQVIVLSILIEILGLTTPYYLQIGIDSVLPSGDVSLLTQLGLTFAVIAFLQGATLFARAHILIRSGAQLGYSLSINLARHLLRLPISWYQRRMLGDTVGRINAIEPIQDALTRGAVLALVDGLFAGITLTVMLLYSPVLTLVLSFAVLMDFGIKFCLSIAQSNAEREVIEALGKEQTTIIECLRGIVSIRMLGSERERHLIWQNQRSDVVNSRTIAAGIRNQGDTATGIVGNLESVASVWLAMVAVIQGSMTVGMVFAYFALKGMFWSKTKNLVDQVIQLRMLGLYLERLGDIVLAPEDDGFDQAAGTRSEGLTEIVLKDVSYRYSASEPVILNSINLRIAAGSHVGITGESGGGKSTLIKIILGLIKPTSGSVTINGVDIRDFGYRNYHRLMSAVVQEDGLFTGSIADNVSMFAHEPDSERIDAALRNAEVYHDVMAMPLKQLTLVGDMGSTLSSGQRQRILIARALYREPLLLVMDEGTSHLDSRHEALIAKNLNQMNVTRITVAHREETLRHADVRYVLRGGTLCSHNAEVDAENAL